MKYTPISISPEQAQFLETRKFQINEIARIFRVPPHMVGDLEKSSFSNIEQQSLEFVKYTLDPWVIRWEQSIMRTLLSPDEKKKCAFVIDNITVEKDGTMVWDERTDQDTIEAVIIALAAAGFNPEKEDAEAEKTGLVIEIPLDKVSVGNLTKLLDAKGSLIKKALGVDDIRIEIKEDRIAFPWFSELPSPEEIKAYSHFIAALCEMSRNQKRITAKEKEVMSKFSGR